MIGKKDLSGLDRAEVDRMALDRILRSASVSEQSTAKIIKKLESAGFPTDSIERSVARACELGIIDDVRYCECLVRGTLASGKGLSRVEKEVAALGLEIRDLEAYQDHLSEGQDRLFDSALDYLMRHPSRSKDKWGASMRKLISRGFEYDLASRVTRTYLDSIQEGYE